MSVDSHGETSVKHTPPNPEVLQRVDLFFSLSQTAISLLAFFPFFVVVAVTTLALIYLIAVLSWTYLRRLPFWLTVRRFQLNLPLLALVVCVFSIWTQRQNAERIADSIKLAILPIIYLEPNLRATDSEKTLLRYFTTDAYISVLPTPDQRSQGKSRKLEWKGFSNGQASDGTIVDYYANNPETKWIDEVYEKEIYRFEVLEPQSRVLVSTSDEMKSYAGSPQSFYNFQVWEFVVEEGKKGWRIRRFEGGLTVDEAEALFNRLRSSKD